MEPLYIPEDALPPEQVRLTEVRVEPWPDGRRVRVHISLTPFMKPPNLQAIITTPEGLELASAMVVESIQHRLVFTMHVRDTTQQNPYRLTVILFYHDLGELDRKMVEFSLPENPENA